MKVHLALGAAVKTILVTSVTQMVTSCAPHILLTKGTQLHNAHCNRDRACIMSSEPFKPMNVRPKSRLFMSAIGCECPLGPTLTMSVVERHFGQEYPLNPPNQLYGARRLGPAQRSS